MEELRDFIKNNQSSAIAWKWQSEPFFDLLLELKILEYNLVLRAAFILEPIMKWDLKWVKMSGYRLLKVFINSF
jgi:hypothetical protein